MLMYVGRSVGGFSIGYKFGIIWVWNATRMMENYNAFRSVVYYVCACVLNKWKIKVLLFATVGPGRFNLWDFQREFWCHIFDFRSKEFLSFHDDD